MMNTSRRNSGEHVENGVELPSTPFVVPTQPRIQILSFGRLYCGENSKRYMRRSKNEYIHPIPVGFKCSVNVFDTVFHACVMEGDTGPVFKVKNMKSKKTSTGMCCTTAWETALVEAGFERELGTKLFGFTDPTVQNLLKGMVNTPSTNIEFIESPRKKLAATSPNSKPHLFHNLNAEQWTEVLASYRTKLLSEITVLERNATQVKVNNKRKRNEERHDSDSIRAHQKRKRVSQIAESQDLLEIDIYDYKPNANSSERVLDEGESIEIDQPDEIQAITSQSLIHVPESQIVESSQETSKPNQSSQSLELEQHSRYARELVASEHIPIQQTEKIDLSAEEIIQPEPIETITKNPTPEVVVDHTEIPEEVTEPIEQNMETTEEEEQVQKQSENPEPVVPPMDDNSPIMDDDHTMILDQTLLSPVNNDVGETIFELETKEVDESLISSIIDEDDREEKEKALESEIERLERLERGEHRVSFAEEPVTFGSTKELIHKLEGGTQFPTSPPKGRYSIGNEEELPPAELQEPQGSPELDLGGGDGDPEEDDDRVDDDETEDLGTLPSFIKPKASQHSLPNHAINKINTHNELKIHSKFKLDEPVLNLEFSPMPNEAKFVICTDSIVRVYELNDRNWEANEEITLADKTHERFLVAKFTPKADKLIIAGLFCETSGSEELLQTAENTYYAIRIYDMTGLSRYNHCLNGAPFEPSLTLHGHRDEILTMLISAVDSVLLSSDAGGVVMKYNLDSDWSECRGQVVMPRRDNSDAPVLSLSFIPTVEHKRLLIGTTKSSSLLWDYVSAEYRTVYIEKEIQMFKSVVLRVQANKIISVILYQRETALSSAPSQDPNAKHTGLYGIGKECRVLHTYKRKENPSQSQTATQTRDNITALTVASPHSYYMASGTERGRVLIFNYKTTQCVGILVDLDAECISALSFHHHLPLLLAAGQNGTVMIYYQEH